MSERTLARAVVLLWKTLSRKRKGQFTVLLLLMVAASLAEIFSLGMIVPFLAALTTPDRVSANALVARILQSFPFVQASALAWWLAGAFCVATILAAVIRLLLLYASTGFSFALGADLSLDVYNRTLHQPYRVHVSRNSSEIINGVTGKTNAVINNVIGQLLTIASSAIILVGILSALFAISPPITLSAIGAFVVIYGGILFWSRVRLAHDSSVVARESTNVVKALQEGLGGIRDVLIDGTQSTFTNIFQDADRKMRAAQGRMAMTMASPRYVVEGLGMIFIAVLAVVASDGGQKSDVVPVLGALALGAQRLLPVVQQAYSSLVTIRGSEASLWDVLDLLKQSPPVAKASVRPLPFDRELRVDDVSFCYSANGPAALQHINLVIPRGARVGIFGPTGGGKSTFLDLLMGLLEPTEGRLVVDDQEITAECTRGWQAHIAHVPQSIYLSDASISENIAFGAPKESIDLRRVMLAAKLAQIHSTIESWAQGYHTPVGERGVRLSGGQRQRIGIARALYKGADVIIFDEATSALDDETERTLMQAIEGLSHELTIVMVAHRLSTLRNCDMVVEIADGKSVNIGSYGDLIGLRAAVK